MATLRDFAPGYEQATFTSLVPDYADEDGPLPTRYGPDMSGYDAKAELDNTSELGKGYKSGRLNLEASYLASEEASLRAAGDRAAADLLAQRRAVLEERAAVFAPSTQELTDVLEKPSLRSAGNWLAGNAGQLGASMVDPFTHGLGASAAARGISAVGTVVAPFTGPAAPFVAGASRLLGAAAPYIGEAAAFVPGYEGAKGGAYRSMLRDPELMARTTAQERDNAASLSGVGQAALDTLIPGAMRRRMMGENLYGAAERGLNRLPLAAGVALDSLGEGAQEVVQDRMEKAALSYLNPDRDTSGDWRDTIDNFAAGAVGFAPMAAGSRYMGKGRERLGAEGDGKNGDVIDLNAPDEKPPTTLESLNGGKSRFNKRAEAEALVAALEGHEEDPAKIPEAAARQKSVLMEELSKLKGKEAEEHLQRVSGIPIDDPLDAIENLGAPEFLDAAKFVMQKLHITNAELARMKNNAERELIRRTPEDEAFRDRMNEIVRPTRQEQAIDKRAKRAEGDTGVDELRTLKPEAVDPSAFKFELDPSHFLAPTETGATGKTINERAAANRARLEQAQNKAKVFNARAELVANKLWNAYTDEHGYEVDAEGALEPSRIRQGDPQAVGIIRELAQELTAVATVTTPTPSEERRAQRLAEQLVQTVGTKAVDVLTDINRITGSTMALKGIVSAASSYLGATNSSALKVQHETRDAAAVELTKLIPAEIEMRLAKDHGVDLSSNKDRNDLLDLMESVADGKASVPRIKLNKLFSKPVVDAMESYLGKTIMPRLEGVKDDLIDENDDYGSTTQATDTEGTHDTEQSAADLRDLTSNEDISDFDQRQLEKNMDRVAPDSLVFHVSGDKRGSMVKFSDAWKENDDGRLPKLIHPGDGRTLEHVQKLVAKATERLGPEQRDRYVMGNPASKDPLEAAGATSAKKILDDSNVPDDQRLKLMMRYMEQEDTKGKQDFTEAHERMRSISYLESVDRALTDIVAKRESVDPYGRKLSIDEAAALKSGENQTPFSIDIPKLLPLLTPKDAETAQALWASRQDVNTKVSQEELFRTMAPIVHRAKEVARQHLSDIAPGADGFFAKNPNADLKDYVNDFFSQRYAVVAEQPTDRDYLQMNLAEFNDMAKKGESNLNSAWVTAGDNEAEQAKVKAGMNIIHFKSRHSGTGEVAIPAYKLVKWVREQENAHTDDKRENDTGQGSQNAQYDSYLDALQQGIAALHMGGLTEGLPWIMNAKGEREEFSPADTKGEPAGGTVDDFGTRWAPTKSSTKTFTDDFGDRVTSLGADKNYSVGKEMSFRKAGKTEVENGWVRTGLGDLPPSLDVGGISYADYKRSKAYGAMHKRGAASSEAVHNRGLIDAKAEEAKNAELSQDEKDVQGEEAVDEAMVIDQGSRTREEERKHLKLMSSVMRAAADHLPKALTVGAAVNKAGKVAEQLWRDYAADREAGLERIFGYVRSMRRPASDDGYEYNKALGELWREFHAADDSQDVERGPGATRGNPGDTLAKSLAAAYPDATPEHLSDLLSRGVQAQNDPQGRGAVDTATTDNAGNIQKAIAEKAAEPKGAGHWGVGGIQYAFPLAALLTPRNIANANPADQATFKRLRSVVAAEIIRAALPDPKTPKLPPVLGTGQVRKLVNFMSGYNDQQKTEKLDKAKPPGDRALLERSKLAPVATSFVPNGGMNRFLQGLIDTKQGDIDLFPQSNSTFEGENRTAAPLVRGFTTYERERAAENFINAAREYGIVTEDGHLRGTRPVAVKQLLEKTGARADDVNRMLGTTEGKSDAGVKPTVSYSRGEGSTLEEREAARAKPVASVAGGRSTAKNVSLDYKGETIDHDAEIAALEAEYTARGIPNARGVSPILGDTPMPSKVETKEPSKVAAPLLKNPPKAPARYQAIETAKLAGATHVIAPVSAGDYSGYLGRAAQAEGKRFSPKVATDMTGKVVLVSVPGGNKGSAAVVAQIIEHVKMALDRGAIVRTDIERIATSAYNAEGEGVLRKALIEGGYAEKPGEMYSEWVAPSKVGTKEPRKVETKEPIKSAGVTTVREHPDSGFRQRTIDNVSAAGVTVAIATDFTTAGERLTRNTAEAQGKYLALDFSLPADKAGLRLAKTMRSKDTSTLNVAGNGIYTLVKSGHTQASVNQHVYDIIAAAHALHPITKIVSGGQTGVDIAGAVAARALGIPSVITLPKGYRQRNVNNQDVTLTNAEVRKQIIEGVEGLKNTPSSQIQAPGATTAASEGVGSQNTLQAAIAKHQEYLKNPPEDYTTERAAAIGAWAAKQHARVAAELAKTDDSTDQYDRLDELRFKLEQLGKASAAKVVESTEAEEHERKYGPQGPRVKGMGRSEKLRNERQKLRSTALAELKADWPEAYRYALAHPERTIDDEFELSGEFSKALTELDTELDSAVAQLQARSDTPHVTQLRERLNDLHESFVSGEGGYDVLYRQYIGIDAAIAELETKLGPQGSVKRNAEAAAAQQAEAQAANQFAKLGTMAPPKHIEVTAAEKWFERNVSDKVKLILQDVFPDMKGGSADFDTLTNIARISTANPLRIMRLTYHEGVHAFFNTILNAKGMEKTKELMYRVASDPKVYNRVKELLKGETEALADMERDPEERVAYMFQFYKLGLLDIDHAPKTFFEKVQALMRRVFGAVRDSEKALAIFTAFDQGQLKETSAAGRVIEKIMGRGEWRKEMLAKYDKQAQALYTEVMANHLNFRNSESATAKLLGRMWYSNPAYGADTEQVNGQDGVINRTKFKRDYYSNRIRVALKPLQGPNLKRDLETLAEALNNHTEPTSAILRKAKKDLHAILTEYRDYARQAGLDIGFQIGADGEYWARVYEIEKLINGRETFVNMLLTKHGKLMTTIKAGAIQAGESGIATERDVAEMIHQSLIDRLGVQDHKLKALREDGVLSPFFASMNERTLEWLSDEDVAPYLSKDVIGTMTQYISQGVRAAEYTRTFGEGGMGLKDMLAKKGDVKFVTEDGKVVKYEEDGPIRRELVEAAEEKAVEPSKREEWIERRMEDLKRASGAMEGSLGKDISATARKLQAGAMTYQILRLLPLMIFSSMLDANGIRVAGGEWEDMFNAYKRGFAGLWNNWKDLFMGNAFGMRDPDEMEKAALASGVINSDMENEEMGEVHSSEYSSGLTRRINHMFFKAIGITQWDRDMRIVATDAARKAIVRDYNNAVPEHSARWLRELGLKKSDIYINDKGQLVVSAAELMKMKNIKDVAVAQKLLAPTHSAVNRWVNRAIVSPNAGLRPTRASDPHFAMFFQFKSFTYAFQETTMRYAMHEAEHGNFSAAARLLHGVPIMIASDMMKAMVTGGGSMPGYMANWTLVDWIGHGINRSGIGGTSTFLTDMLNGNVVGTLAGPTIDHAVGVAGDLLTGDVGGAITQSLPGVKQLHFLRP